MAGSGILLVFLYDIWTKLGWWYLMYPHTLDALVTVYLLGVPFMIYHAISAVVTFIGVGVPVMMILTKKHHTVASLPQRVSLHHTVPLLLTIVLVLSFSFTGTAMDVPQHTEIWLEHTNETSVTVVLHGSDWSIQDHIWVAEKTTVLSVLQKIASRYDIPVETTYYETFNATLVTAIGSDVNGDADHYWQYYVNGELPMAGCDA